MKNILKSRKLKYGSISTITTIGFILIVLIINIISSILIERYPLDIDLTKESVFKLTDESINFVKNVGEEVTIDILADEKTFQDASEYYAQANKVIEQYTKYNDKISVTYTDIYKNPDVVSKYKDQQFEYGDIIVSSPQRNQKITAYDLFNIEQSQEGSYVSSSKAEQAMTSALVYVTDKNPIKISILEGQSESDISGLLEILKRNSYEIVTQNILTEEIDPSANVVIIAAPARDYTDDQLKKLDKFIDNNSEMGKTVLYLSSPEQQDIPKLSEFLAEWGIKIENSILFETDPKKTYISPFFVMQDMVDVKLVPDYQNIPSIIYPNGRPLTKLFETNQNITVTDLLTTTDTSAQRPIDMPENWDINSVKKEYHTTVLLSSKSRGELENKKTSNILAIGSVDFFQSQLLTSTAIGNSDYILSLINNLLDKKDIVKIIDKQVGGIELGMSSRQSFIVTILFLIVLPLLTIGLGIFIWIRRRNR